MTVPILSSTPARRSRASRKALGPLPPATRLRSDFMMLCDLDPEIAAVSRGDVEIILPDGAVHRPAYKLVLEGGGEIIVDVVPGLDILPAAPGVIAEAAEDLGHSYQVETPSTVRAEPRFSTARLVAECRRVRVGAGDRVRVLAALEEAGPLPLIEVASAVRASRDGVEAVLSLACEGLVAVALDAPLGPETPVRALPRICAMTPPSIIEPHPNTDPAG